MRVVAGLGTEAAGDEALQRANADGRIDIAAPAGGLAGRAADASADRGERVVRAGDPVGVLVAAFRDGRDIAAGIGVHRAGMAALHHLHPVIGRVRDADLVEAVLHGRVLSRATCRRRTPPR